MRIVYHFAITVLLLGLAVLPTQAAFTSLRIFGDGISTTTNNSSVAQAPQDWYGLRESNGRVWVEVLAQRLGLGANSMTNVNWSNSANNWSYYGQYSFNLATNINYFAQPPDAATALFVVWVNNADFVNDMGTIYYAGNYTNNFMWTNAINQSLASHWSIITNLYFSKGARTIIMPNAVDITEIPQYSYLTTSAPNDRNYIRQQVINFNTAFTALLNQAQATLPGLTIYQPDFFSLLDNVLTNASAYGLTNALYSGTSIDALEYLPNAAINGAGTNFVFWDATDPTAKLHEIMADTVQQMIAPVQFSQISILGSPLGYTTNQLTVINMPTGLNGFVDGSTNLGQTLVVTQSQVPGQQQESYSGWGTVANFNSISTTQTISFIAPPLPQVVLPSGNGSINPGGPNGGTTSTNTLSFGVAQCYRLRFPLTWNWP